uniref:Uncharacterized protein n=1 Tax=Arundo donax TaxID=35708 RepID=A0A0A9H6Z7_ARUDO
MNSTDKYHPITEYTPFHQSERFNSTLRFPFLHDPRHKHIVLESVCIPMWLSIECIQYIEVIRVNILPLIDRLRNYLYKITQFNGLISYSLEEGALPNTNIPFHTKGQPLLLRGLR